jgi:hypothetical protein
MRVERKIRYGDGKDRRENDRGGGAGMRGEAPVVKWAEKKENASMISAITNQGKVHWKLMGFNI